MNKAHDHPYGTTVVTAAHQVSNGSLETALPMGARPPEVPQGPWVPPAWAADFAPQISDASMIDERIGHATLTSSLVTCVRALGGLTADEQRRVLTAAAILLGVESSHAKS